MAGKPHNLPLIVSYPAGRFWKKKRDRGVSHEKTDIGTLPRGSRLHGYDHWLNPGSENSIFIKWFKTQKLAALQRQKDFPEIEIVRQAITNCIADCENIFFDIREDALMIKFRDRRVLPFDLLSHGVRNMLATVGDIAFRCVMLNPHLGENAAIQTAAPAGLVTGLQAHKHQAKIITNCFYSYMICRTNLPD